MATAGVAMDAAPAIMMLLRGCILGPDREGEQAGSRSILGPGREVGQAVTSRTGFEGTYRRVWPGREGVGLLLEPVAARRLSYAAGCSACARKER